MFIFHINYTNFLYIYLSHYLHKFPLYQDMKLIVERKNYFKGYLVGANVMIQVNVKFAIF